MNPESRAPPAQSAQTARPQFIPPPPPAERATQHTNYYPRANYSQDSVPQEPHTMQHAQRPAQGAPTLPYVHGEQTMHQAYLYHHQQAASVNYQQQMTQAQQQHQAGAYLQQEYFPSGPDGMPTSHPAYGHGRQYVYPPGQYAPQQGYQSGMYQEDPLPYAPQPPDSVDAQYYPVQQYQAHTHQHPQTHLQGMPLSSGHPAPPLTCTQIPRPRLLLQVGCVHKPLASYPFGAIHITRLVYGPRNLPVPLDANRMDFLIKFLTGARLRAARLFEGPRFFGNEFYDPYTNEQYVIRIMGGKRAKFLQGLEIQYEPAALAPAPLPAQDLLSEPTEARIEEVPAIESFSEMGTDPVEPFAVAPLLDPPQTQPISGATAPPLEEVSAFSEMDINLNEPSTAAHFFYPSQTQDLTSGATQARIEEASGLASFPEMPMNINLIESFSAAHFLYAAPQDLPGPSEAFKETDVPGPLPESAFDPVDLSLASLFDLPEATSDEFAPAIASMDKTSAEADTKWFEEYCQYPGAYKL